MAFLQNEHSHVTTFQNGTPEAPLHPQLIIISPKGNCYSNLALPVS